MGGVPQGKLLFGIVYQVGYGGIQGEYQDLLYRQQQQEIQPVVRLYGSLRAYGVGKVLDRPFAG